MELADCIVPIASKVNICFDCQKACGGCSWSELDPETGKPRFEPIPGWTAKKVMLTTSHGHGKSLKVETFHITECPEFERDEYRPSNNVMLTPQQSDDFLEHITHILRRWCDE